MKIIGKIRLQVTYTRKLVDATCCETIVPSSSPPGFRVADGVNFMPVNGKKFSNANDEDQCKNSFSSGLSGVKSQQKKYLIIGGGKTGIDAVLYLLDHGVDPDRLMWVIPNDAWFLNRKFDTEEEIYKFVRTQIESTLHEEDDTWQKVLLR